MFKLNCASKCEVCQKCCIDIKTLKRCPGCAELNSRQVTTKLDHSQQLISFKKSLNCFFMDIVNDLCFNDKHNLPDNQVIESIIENLMPRTRAEQNAGLLDLNLNKTIKSTLFQLLLNYKKTTVHKHLDKILSKSENFLKETYNASDLNDLKVMLINSIENNFYSTFVESDSKLNKDVELGIQFLRELNNSEMNDDSYSKQVNDLETIAKIKFILGTFARLFDECRHEEAEISKKCSEFVRMTEWYLSSSRRSKFSLWPRFFLIKYVFRKYGQSVLMDSVKSEMFKWIIPKNLLLQSKTVRFIHSKKIFYLDKTIFIIFYIFLKGFARQFCCVWTRLFKCEKCFERWICFRKL